MENGTTPPSSERSGPLRHVEVLWETVEALVATRIVPTAVPTFPTEIPTRITGCSSSDPG